MYVYVHNINKKLIKTIKNYNNNINVGDFVHLAFGTFADDKKDYKYVHVKAVIRQCDEHADYGDIIIYGDVVGFDEIEKILKQ